VKIAIVGAGGMGSWFARYLRSRGADIVVHDIDKHKDVKASMETNSAVADSFEEAVSVSEALLLATPISTVPTLIRKAVKMGFRGLLVEISSVKHRVINELRAFKGRSLSIHPLFGPGLADYSHAKCILVPVKDPVNELKLAQEMFPEFRFEVMSAEEHDRSVAITISLVYAVNLAFISLLAENPLVLKVEGTTGRAQKMLALAVLANTPELIVELMGENPFLEEALSKLTESAKMRWSMNDVKSLIRKVREKLGLDPSEGYRWMYKALGKENLNFT